MDHRGVGRIEKLVRRPRGNNNRLAWPNDVLLAVDEHVELPLCHVKRLIKSQVNVFAWPTGVGMDYDPLYITLVSLGQNVLLYPFHLALKDSPRAGVHLLGNRPFAEDEVMQDRTASNVTEDEEENE